MTEPTPPIPKTIAFAIDYFRLRTTLRGVAISSVLSYGSGRMLAKRADYRCKTQETNTFLMQI